LAIADQMYGDSGYIDAGCGIDDVAVDDLRGEGG
jgi:hypothetical protein